MKTAGGGIKKEEHRKGGEFGSKKPECSRFSKKPRMRVILPTQKIRFTLHLENTANQSQGDDQPAGSPQQD